MQSFLLGQGFRVEDEGEKTWWQGTHVPAAWFLVTGIRVQVRWSERVRVRVRGVRVRERARVLEVWSG